MMIMKVKKIFFFFFFKQKTAYEITRRDWSSDVCSSDLMRDYNHWAVLGVLNELLPLAENRVTLAEEKDGNGMPVAYFHYSQCDNDRRNVAFSKNLLKEIWENAG